MFFGKSLAANFFKKRSLTEIDTHSASGELGKMGESSEVTISSKKIFFSMATNTISFFEREIY